MQEKCKNRKFTKEFELEVVKMVVGREQSQTKRARNNGLSVNLLVR